MIIDFHTHCFPDTLAPRVIPMLAAEADIDAHLSGTVPDLVASMHAAGVDYSVLLQIASKPTQNHTVNTWAIARNEPGIIPFGSVHPQGTDWKSELDRLAAAGIKGVKLHPEYQQFYVDDASMFPLYEHIDALGLIVIFHAGVDIGIAPPVHSTPHHFSRVLDRLPKGRTILAHMGGWKSWDEVENKLVGSHLIFDTSFCEGFIDPAQMQRIIHAHGPDHIVMGSDSPWDSQSAAIATVRKLGLDDAAERGILGENAARLLGLA